MKLTLTRPTSFSMSSKVWTMRSSCQRQKARRWQTLVVWMKILNLIIKSTVFCNECVLPFTRCHVFAQRLATKHSKLRISGLDRFSAQNMLLLQILLCDYEAQEKHVDVENRWLY